jgi:hypothetical protein
MLYVIRGNYLNKETGKPHERGSLVEFSEFPRRLLNMGIVEHAHEQQAIKAPAAAAVGEYNETKPDAQSAAPSGQTQAASTASSNRSGGRRRN